MTTTVSACKCQCDCYEYGFGICRHCGKESIPTPTNPPTETGLPKSNQCKHSACDLCSGYLEHFPHLKGYTCNCECHKKATKVEPTVEKWEEVLLATQTADLPKVYGYYLKGKVVITRVEPFLSVQEAKVEERERIHKQINEISHFSGVDIKSTLAYKWLLMEMESQDHKASLTQEEEA